MKGHGSQRSESGQAKTNWADQEKKRMNPLQDVEADLVKRFPCNIFKYGECGHVSNALKVRNLVKP